MWFSIFQAWCYHMVILSRCFQCHGSCFVVLGLSVSSFCAFSIFSVVMSSRIPLDSELCVIPVLLWRTVFLSWLHDTSFTSSSCVWSLSPVSRFLISQGFFKKSSLTWMKWITLKDAFLLVQSSCFCWSLTEKCGLQKSKAGIVSIFGCDCFKIHLWKHESIH